MLTNTKHILPLFNAVTLEEASGVKLMSRIDRKFWFETSKLSMLLEQLMSVYDVLEVADKRLVGYQTIYFDTPSNQMYLHHHNGFRDRFKVRRRKYETSDNGFFEIKRKTNKQRTVKERIEVPFHENALTDTELQFLNVHTPYKQLHPYPVLFNSFRRITLINKNKLERCTIDVDLKMGNGQNDIFFDNLTIIELKRGNQIKLSPLVVLLKELKIRQKGLSKYCTGRAILEPRLKRNGFKPRLLHLERKILNNQQPCITS